MPSPPFDAHAECDGGNYDVNFLHEEFVLVGAAGGCIHARMVGGGFDAVDAEHFCEFLDFFPAQAIDDAGFSFVVFDEFDDVFGDVALFGAHFVVEVRAVERGFEHLRVQHVQVFLDVVLHFGRGGGGQGNDGRPAYFLDNRADFAVFRPEVVSPFRDAVGFVHGKEGDFYFFEELHVAFFGQRFGCHV